ncbi:MAG: triphosphoribosyl-dephospho-CoA synthase [Candidatus Obscuribacterales bacterium]|nr:triphosphoribosyl-dephospho-CoA synthase [Candidatus Obscuribacterales bacterium]
MVENSVAGSVLVEKKPRWQTLGKLASSVLLAEARLTPKPGLVDERGCGAHIDVTLEAMLKSALILEPFFHEMAQIAVGQEVCMDLRERLADCGRRAEIAMYAATEGSNAHRGAIWCLGLLVAATAMHDDHASVWDICETAAHIAKLRDSKAQKADTNGLIVERSYGVKGARGEAQAGFPHVTAVGLPYLRHRRKEGFSESSARLDTLLGIMSTLDDTCLLYRGGMAALNTAKRGAKEVLRLGGTNTVSGMNMLFQLDKRLIALKASPGGSANLLSATLFLDALNLKDPV